MDDLFDKPNKKPKISIPRAKLFLRARLGWLWGYPKLQAEGWVWQAWYYPQPWEQHSFRPNEQDLAQAAYAYNRLIANFPKALPEVVGNVELWREQVSRKLKAIRQLIEGQSVEPWQALVTLQQHQRLMRRVQHLKQQYPNLSQVLDNFIWWLSLDLEAVYQAVTWLEADATNLSVLMRLTNNDIDYTMHLFALMPTIPLTKVQRLVAMLLNPIWYADDITYYKNTFQQYFTYLKKVNIHADFKEIDTYASHKTVSALTRWQQWLSGLLLKTPKQRKLEIEAVNDLLTPELLADWQAWHELSCEFVQTYERKRQSLVKLGLWKTKKCPIEEDKELVLRSELVNYIQACIPSLLLNMPSLFLNMQQLFNLINSVYEQPVYGEWLTSLMKQLAKLPASHSLRDPATPLLFLWHWQKLADTTYTNMAYRRQVMTQWLHYLQSATSTEQLVIRVQPWLGLREYAADYHHWRAFKSPEAELLYDDEAINSALFFQSLAQLAERAPALMSTHVLAFYEFYTAVPATWPQLDYFLALHEKQLSLNVEAIDLTALLRLLAEDTSPANFVRVIEAWQLAKNSQAEPETKQLQAFTIASWLQHYGYTDLVALLKPAFAWEGDAVKKLSMQQRLLNLQQQSLACPIISGTTDLSFMQAYPAALQPSLQRLARYHLEAAAVAQRIWQKQFPDSEQVQQ
jgi:hypothetical protein